jgi:hypothetical protein
MATTGAAQTYATELAGLWTTLSRALAELDAIAAKPAQRLADEDAPERLARLRYVLHSAGELALGIAPPEGSEQRHAELAYALAHARDMTAVVAAAVAEDGVEAVQGVLYEWRGALYAVRTARGRIAEPPARAAATDRRSALPPPATALVSVATIMLGAAVFAGGTLLHRWPIWGLGLLLLTVGSALTAKRR